MAYEGRNIGTPGYITPNPNIMRGGTAMVWPQTDWAGLYNQLSEKGRQWNRYAYEVGQQRKQQALAMTNFQYDPNLTEGAVQQHLMGKVDKFIEKASDIYKNTNYNPSTEQLMRLNKMRNVLYGYQSQMLGSQQMLNEAVKQMQKNPGLYSEEYFNQQYEKFRSGNAVNTFLQLNPGVPKEIIRSHVSELAKDSLQAVQRTTIEGDAQVTTMTKKLQDMSIEDAQASLGNLYLTNPTFQAGVNQEFTSLPKDEQTEWGTAVNWMKNNEEYLEPFGQNVQQQYRTKPDKSAGDEDVVKLTPDNNGLVSFAGANRKGEGPIPYQLPIKGAYDIQGNKVADYLPKDAEIVGVQDNISPGGKAPKGKWALVSVPKVEGGIEVTDEMLKDVPEGFKELAKTYMEQELGEGEVSRTERSLIFVPYRNVKSTTEKTYQIDWGKPGGGIAPNNKMGHKPPALPTQ